MASSQTLFQEKSKFPIYLFAIIFLVIVLAFFFSADANEISQKWIPLFFIPSITSLFLYSITLSVSITSNATHSEGTITYRFTPFIWKTRDIPSNQIVSASVIKIRPLRDFGGWGIRYGKKGIAYTVRGSHVLAISLTNGKRMYLGISDYQQAQQALEKLNLPAFPNGEL